MYFFYFLGYLNDTEGTSYAFIGKFIYSYLFTNFWKFNFYYNKDDNIHKSIALKR